MEKTLQEALARSFGDFQDDTWLTILTYMLEERDLELANVRFCGYCCPLEVDPSEREKHELLQRSQSKMTTLTRSALSEMVKFARMHILNLQVLRLSHFAKRAARWTALSSYQVQAPASKRELQTLYLVQHLREQRLLSDVCEKELSLLLKNQASRKNSLKQQQDQERRQFAHEK